MSVFVKSKIFEILYGTRGNDNTLSIMLHYTTIWCHMMVILASFDSQRNRLSTNTYSVFVLQVVNLSLKAIEKG